MYTKATNQIKAKFKNCKVNQIGKTISIKLTFNFGKTQRS